MTHKDSAVQKGQEEGQDLWAWIQIWGFSIVVGVPPK